MIATLIGGPAHGEEITVSDNPHPSIQVPKLEAHPILPYLDGDFKPVPGPLEVHDYKLLYQDGRYAIYRWQAPRVVANFAFTIHGPDYDGKLYDKLHNLTEEGEAVRIATYYYDGQECSVSGQVLVDGPPDAKASADAAKAVKAVIERKLRNYSITGFAVDVSDG